MAGYLDQYGAGDERRAAVIKWILIGIAAILVLGLLPWYLFKNHTQEGVVRTFLSEVRNHDYQSAYKTWGCGNPKPCTGYPYDRFLEDWGDKSSADPKLLRI